MGSGRRAFCGTAILPAKPRRKPAPAGGTPGKRRAPVAYSRERGRKFPPPDSPAKRSVQPAPGFDGPRPRPTDRRIPLRNRVPKAQNPRPLCHPPSPAPCHDVIPPHPPQPQLRRRIARHASAGDHPLLPALPAKPSARLRLHGIWNTLFGLFFALLAIFVDSATPVWLAVAPDVRVRAVHRIHHPLRIPRRRSHRRPRHPPGAGVGARGVLHGGSGRCRVSRVPARLLDPALAQRPGMAVRAALDRVDRRAVVGDHRASCCSSSFRASARRGPRRRWRASRRASRRPRRRPPTRACSSSRRRSSRTSSTTRSPTSCRWSITSPRPPSG